MTAAPRITAWLIGEWAASGPFSLCYPRHRLLRARLESHGGLATEGRSLSHHRLIRPGEQVPDSFTRSDQAANVLLGSAVRLVVGSVSWSQQGVKSRDLVSFAKSFGSFRVLPARLALPAAYMWLEESSWSWVRLFFSRSRLAGINRPDGIGSLLGSARFPTPAERNRWCRRLCRSS